MIVSRAIVQLMAMGQFIDASLYFNEGLEVLKRMPDTPRRKCVEIGGTCLSVFLYFTNVAIVRLSARYRRIRRHRAQGVCRRYPKEKNEYQEGQKYSINETNGLPLTKYWSNLLVQRLVTLVYPTTKRALSIKTNHG